MTDEHEVSEEFGPVPGERAWTEEQRRAIDRRDGDLLLDAAAGSGKTSVLVERFARAVLDDGVDVTAILVITFTEKAAAELRDRIRARLRELGAPEQARRTEGAFISTIHGFCARVLRSHALAAGLDPRFAVLDAYRSAPLAATAFDEALAALATEAGVGDEAVAGLVADYGVGTLRTAVRSVHDQLRAAGFERPTLPAVAPADPGAGERLRAAATAVAAELGAVADPGASVVTALARVSEALALVGAGGEAWPGDLWRLKLPRNGAALSTDACEAYSAALADFRAAAGAVAAAPVRELLDALLRGYATRYAEAKARVSGLDFDDLELVCRRLLAGDAELRERYAQRFAAIMVDELQDTNRVQLSLVESIARGNLFTVGDAQQSIYGFRHADVELFRERGRRLEGRGERETLRTNFRTRPEIVDVLNPAFAEAMGDAFTPLRAGRSPVAPVAPVADATGGAEGEPLVELLVADKGADWDLEGLASPWRLAEARALAARVAQLVAGGAAPADVVVLLRASTDMRAYERALEAHGLPTYVIGGRGYWDHPQVVDMVAYLRALANPRDEESLYGVLASPLVGVSLDALVLLAGAARAGDRDPWRILRDGLDGVSGLADFDRARLRSFVEWFAASRAAAPRLSLEQLLDRALVVSGYDLAMLAMPGGPRRLANVRKLMRLGREHEAAAGPDLRGFLDVIDDREAGRSPENREGEAPVEGEGLDAIRLMTIHRAKGLEFPIVCVADLGRSPRPPAAVLRVAGADPAAPGSGRLGLRLIRAGAGSRESALDYTSIGEEVRAAEEREERRLFYVAMTRARERLVLSGAAKLDAWREGELTRAGGGPIGWIGPAFVADLPEVLAAGGGEVRRGDGRLAVSFPTPESVGGAAVVAAVATSERGAMSVSSDDTNIANPPAPPTAEPPAPVATLSYSALAAYDRCGYRFYAERVLGLPPGAGGDDDETEGGSEEVPRPAALSSASASAARRRGVLAHALLERLDFRRPVVPSVDVARAAAVRAGLAPPPGPAELDELAVLVRAFAGSELCRRLGAAGDARREQRFAFPLTERPGDPLLVGVFDVLARERGGASLVVDYKTDALRGRRPAEIVAERYAGQQLVYAAAALQAGAAEAQIAHCFLAAPDEPVIATYAAADLPELMGALRERAAGVLAHRFAVAPDPRRALCDGCPARGGLCSWPVEMTRRQSADTLF